MNTTATRRGSPADFEICFAAPLPREYAQTLAVIMETELHTVLLYFRSNALKACSSRFSFFLFFIYIVVIIYRRFFHARYTWKGREERRGDFKSCPNLSHEICEGDGRRIFHVVRDLRKDEIKMTIS